MTLIDLQDELVWGASWMYKATNDNTYYQYLVSNGATLGGTTTSTNAFSWDNKYAGAQVLLAKVSTRSNFDLSSYCEFIVASMYMILSFSLSMINQNS